MNDRRAGHIRLVAGRELRTRLTSRPFLVGVVMTVVLVIGGFSVLRLIPGDTLSVGVVGDQPAGAVETLQQLEGDDVTVQRLAADVDPAGALDEFGLDAVVVSGDRIVLGEDDDAVVASVSAAWNQAELIERLGAAGLTDAEIAASMAPLEVEVLEPDSDRITRSASSFVLVLALFIAIQIAGAFIMMGIMEEKGTKIVELLLASVNARDLLVGKVVGVGVLGLIQIGALLVAFVAAAVINDIDLPALRVSVLAVGLVWFLLGYLLYGSLFAAGASLAPRQEDAQATLAPISIVVMLSYFAAAAVATSPDAGWSQVLSFLPPIAPFAFPARMASDAAAWWEVGVALLLTAATTALVFSAAARIYVRSVLHTDRKLGWVQGFRMTS